MHQILKSTSQCLGQFGMNVETPNQLYFNESINMHATCTVFITLLRERPLFLHTASCRVAHITVITKLCYM